MDKLPEKLVFVDVETTGSNPQSDRIIELGIIRVENGKVIDKLDTLINPQTNVPAFISNMTGITTADLVSAPLFEDVKSRVFGLLDEAIFVAHNVNFDYSFIKHEFMRLDSQYNAKTLCTVRLARRLFPTMQKYNLDVLIKKFDLPMENRHRAFSDAYALWDFYLKTNGLFDENILLDAINSQIKTNVPDSLSKSDIDNLPESHGVYIFYGKFPTLPKTEPKNQEDEAVLYVGKSNNIRSRVLSHFSSQKVSTKSQNIAKNITRIDHVSTHGELGALLRESQLIKELSPIFNKTLRRKKSMYVLIRGTDKDGYYTVQIKKTNLSKLSPEQVENVVGVFNSKKQAKLYLSDLAKNNLLCKRLLGIESGNGSCFNFQLQRCKGACTAAEMPLKYNLRFLESFSKSLVPKWPFDGSIGIEETGYYGREVHIVDKWCYQGSIIYDKDGNVKETFNPKDFDWDIYKLIKKYVKSTSSRVNLIKLDSSNFSF